MYIIIPKFPYFEECIHAAGGWRCLSHQVHGRFLLLSPHHQCLRGEGSGMYLLSATVLGSIPASSNTVESEGRQMKQCWKSISLLKNPKNPLIIGNTEKWYVQREIQGRIMFIHKVPLFSLSTIGANNWQNYQPNCKTFYQGGKRQGLYHVSELTGKVWVGVEHRGHGRKEPRFSTVCIIPH